MAELIWQAADPKAAGHVATYDSGGARVDVHREAPDGTRGKAVPKWVSVGLGLMEKRIREYRDETGRCTRACGARCGRHRRYRACLPSRL